MHGIGIDLLEIERLERAIARRPGLAERLFTSGEHAESILRVPDVDWMLQALLAVIPLQLLAYGIARRRGLNVDQPRNLAKTVTVE